MTLKTFLKRLEVKPTDDEYEAIATSRLWGNKDVYPIAHDKRTYGSLSFFAYWATAGICVTSFTIGSTLIGVGLNAGQACGAVLVGSVLASVNAYLAGTPGAVHHLGYGILARASFGLWGSYFCVLLNVFQSFVFYGTQMFYGGQAIVLILNSIFPSFLTLRNTLSDSAGITTQGLIGFVLFIVVYFPIIWYLPPHKVQYFLQPAIIVAIATFLGIMGWAVRDNGGPGNLVSSSISISNYEAGFRIVQGITTVAGTYTGGSDRVSDWTRYARSRHAATPAMLTTLPVTVTISAFLGILTASSTVKRFGTLEWNPITMLQLLQATDYTAACRAGTFFAGLGLLSITIFVNYTQNCVSSGMDMAMLMPRYLSRRRGAMLLSILGILAQPWRFLTQATTFLTVLGSFGVFMSPAAAVLMSDYWLVRKGKWNIPEMYNSGGIYWFTAGFNWRAFAAYFLGVFPAVPGFVGAIGGYNISETWTRFYQISYFWGYIVSGSLFFAFNKIWPPEGLGIQVDLEIIEGEEGAIYQLPEHRNSLDGHNEKGFASQIASKGQE